MQKILSLLFLLLLFVSCRDDTAVPTPSANETPGTAANQSNRIVLQMALHDWEIGQYRSLIETFEADNPGIQIELVSIEETLGLGLNGTAPWPDDALLQLVSAADVVSSNIVGTLADTRLLLDLRPLAATDSSFNQADFYPGALAAFEQAGALWGLPTQVSHTLIFYNKDVFAAANTPYPQAGWSWDDFLTAAQATTVRQGGAVSQWGFVEPSSIALEMVISRTGPLTDTTTEPPSAHINQPAVAEVMQWYVDLVQLYEVKPYFDPLELAENGIYTAPGDALIESGQVAMWPEQASAWNWRSSQMNVGVAPFPVNVTDDASTPLFVEGWLISAGTQSPQAAWQWLNFLSHQVVADGFRDDTAVPARRSIAEASGFWNRVDPELGEALTYALDHAYALPSTVGYGAVIKAISAVLTDGETIETALATAQLQAEAEIAAMADATGTPVEVSLAAPEAEATVTLNYLVGGTPDLQGIRALAEQFEEKNPAIHIEVALPNFANSGTLSLADMATTSDCFQWLPNFDNLSDLEAIISLDPFLDSDPTISSDDFYPGALNPFLHQGQVWGLPAELSVSVIEYNKDLFDTANVPYPTPDWTTAEFLEAAVALTQGEAENKQYGYVPSFFEVDDLLLFMERLGAELIDTSQDPPRIVFTDPTTVEAMRWFVNLTTEFQVKPTFMTNIRSFMAFAERQTLIDAGRAAMWVKNSNDVYLFSGSTNGEASSDPRTGIVPLPAGPNGERIGGYNLTGGYFISANSQAHQACWEWLVFLTEQPGNWQFLPVRTAVAQSQTFRNGAGDELTAAFLTTIEEETQPSLNQRLTQTESWLDITTVWLMSAYDKALHENVPVEDALNRVQEIANVYQECLIRQDAYAAGKVQDNCLREADPSLPASFFTSNEE